MTATLDTIEVLERAIAFVSGSGLTPAEIAELREGYSLVLPVSQDAADTASTTSQSTAADAWVYSLVLPSGTWTVKATSTLELTLYDAGPTCDSRVTIAGNAGAWVNRSIGASKPVVTVRSSHSVAGVTGTVNIRSQYKKGSTAVGTLFAANPGLVIACKRTS